MISKTESGPGSGTINKTDRALTKTTSSQMQVLWKGTPTKTVPSIWQNMQWMWQYYRAMQEQGRLAHTNLKGRMPGMQEACGSTPT